MSQEVGLPNNSYKPFANTAWVRARLCKLQKLAVASDQDYQLLAHGPWFSPGTLASSTTKTGRYDIAEIFAKVTLSTKNQIKSKALYSIAVCLPINGFKISYLFRNPFDFIFSEYIIFDIINNKIQHFLCISTYFFNLLWIQRQHFGNEVMTFRKCNHMLYIALYYYITNVIKTVILDFRR